MATKEITSLFSHPEFDRSIGESWQQFLRGDGTSADVLRFLVEDSWRRCVGASVDPGISQAPSPMNAQHVLELQHQHRDLIEACKPVMSFASDFLSETGTVMVLTNPHGIVLDVEGDSNALGPAEKIHLLPGASWDEPHCGTNAIGTALTLGKSVQIHSEEHFCEGIKRWTCSASVIRDPILKEILGVIDISGLSRSYSRHTLPLVVTAANRIESHLAKKEWELRCRLMERCLAYLNTPDGSGTIIFDRHGFPLKLNENAPAILASLGASLDMSKPPRIVGLSDAGREPVSSHDGLPKWLRPEWVEPVFDKNERVGSIVRIPCPRSHGHRVRENALPHRETRPSVHFAGALGSSPEILKAIEKARRLAASRVPILLLGETGVGKEIFARAIHEASRVSDGPFAALNCGGLSHELLASELFGYVDGAFTGARRGGIAGKIEAVDGGTLFLDELGEMPLDLQPHFLRVLEDGRICRLGDTNTRQVRFRLIAATNRDLRQDVSEGRFRMDLFYRVSVTSVRIPALRERQGDIAELTRTFLRQLSEVHEIPLKEIDPSVLRCLEKYSWPGNVRELRNVVESLILTAPDDIIFAEDLPPEILTASPDFVEPQGEDANDSLSVLARSEFEQIKKVLQQTGGNATLAAKELGIAKSTLYLKLKKYSLDESLDSWRTAGERSERKF